MFKKLKLNLLAVLLAGTVLAGCVPPARAAEAPEYDGYLVGTTEPIPSLMAADMDLEPVVDRVYRTDSEALARQLLDSGMADYYEPNYEVTLFDVTPEPGTDPTPTPEPPVPEPEVPVPSWNYEAMAGGAAAQLGLDGNGVRIGVIDSGINPNNKNLQGARILQGGDYVSGYPNGFMDTIGHGSNVAQVIAGVGLGDASMGLAPKAELVPLRCFTRSTTTHTSILVKALDDAVSVYGCQIINMSWGLLEDSVTLHNSIQAAHEAGVILVASVGNNQSGIARDTIYYPAVYPEVIGVGAIDPYLGPAWVSLHSQAVYVTAPGQDMPFLLADGSLDFQNGTSFSSPGVSASAALILQAAPGITSGGVYQVLQDRAIDRGTPGYDTIFGYGSVSLDEILQRTWVHTTLLENNSFQAEGWFSNPTGGSIITAIYRENGSMASCGSIYSRWPMMAIDMRLSSEGGQPPLVTLFFLDPNGAPVAESIGNRHAPQPEPDPDPTDPEPNPDPSEPEPAPYPDPGSGGSL